MTAWKNRKQEYKNKNKKIFDNGKKLREFFTNQLDSFNIDKNLV
jgi:hypothetical protein